MSPREQDHIHALTSLRFFAAFYVLVFHSGGPNLSNSGRLPEPLDNFLMNGYLGVTFFFILSGFILTYVYYGKLTAAPDTLTRYAVARIARVYPVYLLALLLMFPFVSSPLSIQIVPQFFLLQSWVPLTHFDGVSVANSNAPAWTLSVELFFYLIFPWLVRGACALDTRSVAVIAVVLCVIIVALRLPAISNESHLLYNGLRYVPLPLLRAPEFVYGVLLGVLYRRGVVPPSASALYVVMGLVLAVLCCSKSLWVAPIAAILFGGVIALVPTSIGKGLPARFLNSNALVLLGAASYALYLLQTPVHTWILSLLGEYKLTARLIYIPSLLIVSIVVFLFWEEKMREQLRRLSKQRVSLA